MRGGGADGLSDELGSTGQALTSNGSVIKFMSVKMDPAMIERATTEPAPGAGTGSPSNPNTPARATVIEAMSPIKDQGGRGTCATFSSFGVAERYVGLDLSEQCAVAKIDGDDGAWPESRFELLTTQGAVHEDVCRYHATNKNVNIPSPFDYDALARRGVRTLIDYEAWSEDFGAEDAMQQLVTLVEDRFGED